MRPELPLALSEPAVVSVLPSQLRWAEALGKREFDTHGFQLPLVLFLCLGFPIWKVGMKNNN